jgi:hypothetical protein
VVVVVVVVVVEIVIVVVVVVMVFLEEHPVLQRHSSILSNFPDFNHRSGPRIRRAPD